MASVISGTATGFAVSAVLGRSSPQHSTSAPAAGGAAAPVATTGGVMNARVLGQPGDVKAILAKVGPAVAYVRTQAFRGGRFFPSQGAGTGIVISSGGEVLTNAHVVAGATSIKVTLANQTQSHDATLIGADPAADLALLRVEGVSGLPTAELGHSSDLSVGDGVIAIGNALNLQGGFTVTEGIVSALNRSIDAGDSRYEGLIQTDAAINPGNSGGPLLNSAGQVVGINTATSGEGQNIGFAIAIDTARPVIARLAQG